MCDLKFFHPDTTLKLSFQKIMERLVKEIKNNSDPLEKRIALSKFLQAIYEYKNFLVISNYTKFQHYEEIHQQAFQDTILIISQTIDSYELAQPILPWIEEIFKNQFNNALEKQRIDRVSFVSLDRFNYNLAPRSTDDYKRNLRNFLSLDPENILKNTTLPGSPKITLQKLLWLILIEDKSWEIVARELNSNIKTLASFYQKNMQKHKAYFNKYLS